MRGRPRQILPATITGARRCTKCLQVKAQETGFYHDATRYPHPWCKVCRRLSLQERRRSEKFKAWERAYLARPDVQAKRRETFLKHTEKREARAREWGKTPRAKIIRCRAKLKHKMRCQALNPDQTARAEALLAAYNRELARLEAT